MNLQSIIFYFFELTAAAAAVGLIFIRNVFYGALLLIVSLLALAGIYVLAFAEFIAVTQILVYAGGILVVILFGIMLTTRIAGKPLVVEHMYQLSGTLAGLSLFFILVYYLSKETFFIDRAIPQQYSGDVNSIGIDLMSEFMLPFEIAGILLLVALIGAAVTASTVKTIR